LVANIFAQRMTFKGLPGVHFDPVAASFNLLWLCRELGKSFNAHSNKIKRIKRGLKEFQIQMLSLCDGSEQVKVLCKSNFVRKCILKVYER